MYFNNEQEAFEYLNQQRLLTPDPLDPENNMPRVHVGITSVNLDFLNDDVDTDDLYDSDHGDGVPAPQSQQESHQESQQESENVSDMPTPDPNMPRLEERTPPLNEALNIHVSDSESDSSEDVVLADLHVPRGVRRVNPLPVPALPLVPNIGISMPVAPPFPVPIIHLGAAPPLPPNIGIPMPTVPVLNPDLDLSVMRPFALGSYPPRPFSHILDPQAQNVDENALRRRHGVHKSDLID